MFLKPIAIPSTVLALPLVLFAPDCQATVTFLGPTPYLSAADSPFPVDGSNPNFFLEDFEDGLLNTPGVDASSLIFPPAAIVNTPSPTTDSVDGDDGVIDGFGSGGHSLQNVMSPDFLNNYQTVFRFIFSEKELGFLPNAFGLVWTDGPAPAEIGFIAYDAMGDPISLSMVPPGLPTSLGDLTNTGETAEDRFIGLRTTESFSQVIFLANFRPPNNISIIPRPIAEIDHVQYGFIVPEPSAFVSGFVSIFMLFARFLCRDCREYLETLKKSWAIS